MDTKALRQKILDLAIRGKLVPQDPNDEPASVLLDRIREQKKQMVKEGKLKAKDIKNDSVIVVGEDSLHYEKFTDGSVKCIEEEIPFELPDGWSWARLGSIANIVTGRLDANAQTPDGEYPFFTCGEEVFKTDTYAFDCNAILLGGNNATGDFKMHKFSGKFNAYQRVYVITTFPEIDVDYLYNHIRFYLPKLQSQSIGSQTRYLKLGMITDLLVALPTFREQKLVSSSCNKYLNYCTEIASEKDDLKKYIKSAKSKILDLAIRGQLVPQDPADEPASVLLERIRAEKEELIKQGKIKRDKKESIIFKGEDNSYYEIVGKNKICIDEKTPFELPDGWTWIRLRNITQFIRNGASIKQYGDASGLPITRIETISAGEIDRNRFGYADILEIGKYESYVMEDYDILMSHINSPKHLGKCALYRHTDNEVLIHGMNLLSIRPVLCELAEYLCVVFRSNYFKDFVWENMKQAVNQASITTTSISEFLLPMPPYKELKQIIKKSNRMSNIIDIISEELS